MSGEEQIHVDRIWDVIEKARVCMMATQFSDGLRVRPMEALPERDENVICFLTDRRGLREDEIEVCPEVYLTFVYPSESVYLALTGEAFVDDDVDCARRLWDRQQDGWLSGPKDPQSDADSGRAMARRDVGRPGQLRCRRLPVRQGAAVRYQGQSRRHA
jgi:general stress protein 26